MGKRHRRKTNYGNRLKATAEDDFLYDFMDDEALNSCRLTGDSKEKCRVINELANDEKLGLPARSLYELLGSLLFWKKNANMGESVMDICKVGYQLLEEKGIIVDG